MNNLLDIPKTDKDTFLIAMSIIDLIPTELYKFSQIYPLKSQDYSKFMKDSGVSLRFTLEDKTIGLIIASENDIMIYKETKYEIEKICCTDIYRVKDIILKELQ